VISFLFSFAPPSSSFPFAFLFGPAVIHRSCGCQLFQLANRRKCAQQRS
jgi:hypothetical protein